MNRWGALAVLLAFAGALAFRLPKLDTRPFHNDEAVNALKVVDLWQEGRYAYDPDEYHGPTLHYATLPFLSLSGARTADDLTDRTIRLAPVAFGAGLILLLFLFADGLGWHTIAWSALFTAISPAMVFYSRYFIHEMLLVFFTALMLGAAWRYSRSHSAFWAIIGGAAAGLMFATKETFVITLASGALAFALSAGILARNYRWPKLWLADKNLRAPLLHVTLAFAAALVIWFMFFSSFFTHFAGLIDSIRTYLPWLRRAAGQSVHVHPWYFYFQRLAWFHPVKGPVWSEGLILILAVAGAISSFLRSKQCPFLLFITLYTIILTVAYSAISYKTPWCLLSFFHGMILLAGVGAATVLERPRSRAIQITLLAVLVAATAQLGIQSWRASFVYSTDRRNPYVYAQTVPDILHLVQRAGGLARVSPAGFQTIIKVIAPEGDYWPLPWYLRRFKNIGWYENLPDDPFAPIIIVSSKFDARLDDKSDRKWIMAGVSELRPTKFFELYVELDLWKKFVATLPSDRD